MLEHVSEQGAEFDRTQRKSTAPSAERSRRGWRQIEDKWKPDHSTTSTTDLRTLNVSGLSLTMIDGQPSSAIRTVHSFAIQKRAFDIAAAAALIFLFAPLMLLIAFAIKTTSQGSAIFAQNREGLERRIFRIYKFRTMYSNKQDETGLRHTVPGDQRVTLVGKFLRATSLDELPQLLNILLGDMSFVGPRPHVPGMVVNGVRYDELVPGYHFRHLVRPGLTGWAQANGYRGVPDPVGAVERIRHDAAYIQNQTLSLDLRIIVRTFLQEFITGTGA